MENIGFKPFIILKVIIVLLFINLPLSATTSVQEVPQISSYEQVPIVQTNLQEETTEVSLESLGLMGAFILVVLSSLIGAYLLRNEL
jgi:hypothetical protein